MKRLVRIADSGGVLGAIAAALCCAGTPFILSGLAAVGLSFLRRDAILLPLMIASLLIALWGFRQGARLHGRSGPLWLGAGGGVTLAAGVIVVHGPAAIAMIWAGAGALIVATLWNMRARETCETAWRA